MSMTNALPPITAGNPLGNAGPPFHIVQEKGKSPEKLSWDRTDPAKLRPADLGSLQGGLGWGAKAVKGLNSNLRTFLVDKEDGASEQQHGGGSTSVLRVPLGQGCSKPEVPRELSMMRGMFYIYTV